MPRLKRNDVNTNNHPLRHVFEAARRAVEKDLEGFDRSVTLIKKRDLRRMIDEIERERTEQTS